MWVLRQTDSVFTGWRFSWKSLQARLHRRPRILLIGSMSVGDNRIEGNSAWRADLFSYRAWWSGPICHRICWTRLPTARLILRNWVSHCCELARLETGDWRRPYITARQLYSVETILSDAIHSRSLDNTIRSIT